jgi:threonine dehydrogenase-like Zn-dependent dehydrogenase
MRSLYFDGTRPVVCDREAPALEPDTALLRVGLAGVCNTDLEIARGYMGFRGILGHEFTGRVIEGPEAWHGQRVVGEINFACGSCPSCLGGLARHCPTRQVMGILDADGSFAEYVRVPVANLHRVADTIADEVAVFTEPLAAAFEILEQLEVDDAQRCLVLGDGKLGLLVAQVLDGAGARVRVVGRHPSKLGLLERRGIETILARDWQPADEGADLVVDASGSATSLDRAIAATRPRGTVVMKSTVAEFQAVDWAPVVINEIQLLGSRCGPFAPALRALEEGSIEVRDLISERVPLARADEALRRAAEPSALKVLIECQ